MNKTFLLGHDTLQATAADGIMLLDDLQDCEISPLCCVPRFF
jgi:hypothetical protein